MWSRVGLNGAAAQLRASARLLAKPRTRPAMVRRQPLLYMGFSTGADDVILTRGCADRLKALNNDAPVDAAKYLRLSVESGGCSGFQYKFDLDDSPIDDEEDRLFVRDGATLVVDSMSLEFVKGSTIDYEQELIRSGFAVINNPNSEAGCGCGVSFAAKLD